MSNCMRAAIWCAVGYRDDALAGGALGWRLGPRHRSHAERSGRALDQSRRLRGEGDRTPVLVISALSSVDERISGLRAGGDDYLVKPFDIRELGAGRRASAP